VVRVATSDSMPIDQPFQASQQLNNRFQQHQFCRVATQSFGARDRKLPADMGMNVATKIFGRWLNPTQHPDIGVI